MSCFQDWKVKVKTLLNVCSTFNYQAGTCINGSQRCVLYPPPPPPSPFLCHCSILGVFNMHSEKLTHWLLGVFISNARQFYLSRGGGGEGGFRCRWVKATATWIRWKSNKCWSHQGSNWGRLALIQAMHWPTVLCLLLKRLKETQFLSEARCC